MSFRMRARQEQGFSLIELLVVILIIGILGAIAIPSFLNQKDKAYDASAKELARTAETTAEAIAIDNSGSYSNVSPANLNAYEATIATSSSGAGLGNAWLRNAGPLADSDGNDTGYYVQTEAADTLDVYQILKVPGTGQIIRSCGTFVTQLSQTSPYTSSYGGVNGGCSGGSW